MISVKGNVNVFIPQVSVPVSDLFNWGCTKIRNLAIGMGLDLIPPDLHIFNANPSLV